MRGILVYDSHTGNTRRVAQTLGQRCGLECVAVHEATVDLSSYDIAVIATPNIRAMPTKSLCEYLVRVVPPHSIGILVTYDMPLWGPYSSLRCISYIRRLLVPKGAVMRVRCMMPGYHTKYKCYKNRPNTADIEKAVQTIQQAINTISCSV